MRKPTTTARKQATVTLVTHLPEAEKEVRLRTYVWPHPCVPAAYMMALRVWCVCVCVCVRELLL